MNKKIWIGGYNAIKTIYEEDKSSIHKLYLTKNLNEFRAARPEIVTPKFINKIFSKFPKFRHQNIAAEITMTKKFILDKEISNLKKLVILDNITDVNNIGSIIRSSVAFGVDGIIFEKKKISTDNPGIYKTSSGYIQSIKMFFENNLNNCLELLKKNGFHSYALDLKSKKKITDLKSCNDKMLFIFGSEHKGISKLLLKNCDNLIKINTSDKVESLNVSNVAAITLSHFYKN